METMLDIFSGNAFGLVAMTNAVNSLPYSAGELKDILRFEDKKSPTRAVSLDKQSGQIYILNNLADNEPAPAAAEIERSNHVFELPRFGERIEFFNSSFRGLRGTGTNEQMMIEQVRNDGLELGARRLRKTQEFNRFGAVSGEWRNAKGQLLANLRTILGDAAAAPVAWDMNATKFDANEEITKLKETSEDYLGDFVPDDYVLLGGRGFHRELRKHKSVKAAFSELQNLKFLRDDDREKGYVLSDDVLVRSYGREKKNNGQPFLADLQGYFVPRAAGLFIELFGPSDMEEYWGQILEFYVGKKPMDFGKGLEALLEMFHGAICCRPGAIIPVTITPHA
jgi:hypothetical protein